MADNKLDKDAVLLILNHIKDDIKTLDQKLDETVAQTSSQAATLQHLKEDVASLHKVLVLGNGEPSVVVKVAKLDKDVSALKNINPGSKTSVKVERLKVAGKFLALLCIVAAEITVVLPLLQSCNP
jgi:hypothetical protein